MSDIETYKVDGGKELLIRDTKTDRKYAGEWIQSLYKEKGYITFGYFKNEITGLYQAGKVPLKSLDGHMNIYGEDSIKRGELIDSIVLQLIYNNEKCIYIGNYNRLIAQIPEKRVKDIIKINYEEQLGEIGNLEMSNNPIILISPNNIDDSFLFNRGIEYIFSGLDIDAYVSIKKADKYMSESNTYLADKIFEDNKFNFIISAPKVNNYPVSLREKLFDIKYNFSFNAGGHPGELQQISHYVGVDAWKLGDLPEHMFMGKFIVGENHLTNPVEMNVLPEMKNLRYS